MKTYGKLVEGTIEYYKPYKGGLLVGSNIIYGATAEQYNEQGWYEVQNVAEDGTDEIVDGILKHYTGAAVEETYTPTYEELTVQYIREKYNSDDEHAICRHYLADPTTYAEEFKEYNEFVESCKAKAKEETA